MLLAQRWDQDIHTYGAEEEEWTLRGLWYGTGTVLSTPVGGGTYAGRIARAEPGAAANEGNRPDLCDGSKAHYCSLTPQYTNITAILRHYGQDELLEFMNRYWLAAS
jgi:ribonuclease T2